jgi:hypothetical protein
MSNEFFFDLETVPDHERLESFGLEPLPTLPPITPDDQLPNADEITGNSIPALESMLAGKRPSDAWLNAAEAIDKAKKTRKGFVDLLNSVRDMISRIGSASEERRKLLSTVPEFCRLAAMGVAVGSHDVIPFVRNESQMIKEETMLELFWDYVTETNCIIGFNIIHFDLPVIYARSILLDVPPSKKLNPKSWTDDVIDLYQRRFPRGQGKGPAKLKDLAKVYGIKVPAGDVEGSQVEQLYKENPVKLGEYVASDVEITRQLYRKFNGFFC